MSDVRGYIVRVNDDGDSVSRVTVTPSSDVAHDMRVAALELADFNIRQACAFYDHGDHLAEGMSICRAMSYGRERYDMWKCISPGEAFTLASEARRNQRAHEAYEDEQDAKASK